MSRDGSVVETPATGAGVNQPADCLSTRSQLRFGQRIEYETEGGEIETGRRIAQVYRHFDGYPSGVLPALAQLKALREETVTERGPSYVAANFSFPCKLQGMAL